MKITERVNRIKLKQNLIKDEAGLIGDDAFTEEVKCETEVWRLW